MERRKEGSEREKVEREPEGERFQLLPSAEILAKEEQVVQVAQSVQTVSPH